jgi:ParB-like chromosome segregation protein Spo0J
MIDYTVVEDYKNEMIEGAKFPPVVAFYDGTDHWLGDGFHRLRAASAAGLEEIDADVRQGTREDAVWFSCSANRGHGLRRTNPDKQRAVDTAIKLRPGESDRTIAEHCGVSHTMVAGRRPVQVAKSATSAPEKRKGRDGKHYPTPANPRAAQKHGEKREERKPAAADVPDLTDFVSAAPEPQRVPPPSKVDPLTGMLNAISAYPLADLIRARDFIDELIRDRSAA